MGSRIYSMFEGIEKAVTNIAKLEYYDPAKETRVKCDASHSVLGASLEQKAEKTAGSHSHLHRAI